MEQTGRPIIQVSSGKEEDYPYPQAKREDERAQAVGQLVSWMREEIDQRNDGELRGRLRHELFAGIHLSLHALRRYLGKLDFIIRMEPEDSVVLDPIINIVLGEVDSFATSDTERANILAETGAKMVDAATGPLKSDLVAQGILGPHYRASGME